MDSTKSSRFMRIALIAYIDAALFAVRFIIFFLPRSLSNQVQDGTLFGALLGNAEHLLLFPIIAALPAPQWVCSAGYGWLVVDMATDIMALNGAPPSVYLTLRLGGHISCALWFAVASWQARGAIRVIGVIYAFDIALYSYLAAFGATFAVLIPSAILLPAWLILVGRDFTRQTQDQRVQPQHVPYSL